jgi:cytochrome b561
MFTTTWGRNLAPASWHDLLKEIHINCGLIILGITIARLFWRIFNPAPPLLPLPQIQMTAAKLAHLGLYGLLLALPLCGWLMVSAFGHPPIFLNLLELPGLLSKDRGNAILLKEAHEWLAYLLAGLVGLHAGAALAHHYIIKDATLTRMLTCTTAKVHPPTKRDRV